MNNRAKPPQQPEKPHSLVFQDISTLKLHRIINTPMRLLDVIEHSTSGDFELRDTIYASRERAAVTSVHFHPYELMNLGEIIRRIFCDGAPVKARGAGA